MRWLPGIQRHARAIATASEQSDCEAAPFANLRCARWQMYGICQRRLT
jgi:hypothetical protein